MIGLKDTVSLMSAVERFKAPASLLLDTFSPTSLKPPLPAPSKCS